MVLIRVVEFRVPTSIKLDAEKRRHDGDGGVAEETEVLTGDGSGRGSPVGESEAEAEAGAVGDFRQDGEDEGGGEGVERSRGGGVFHGDFGGEESSAEGELVGVIGETNDGGLDAGIVDE